VGERLGDGFADIVALAALAPDLPTTGGEITGVTVTLGLQDLERRAGTVLIDGIGCTSLSDLRRRCWDTHIIPTVLGTRSDVLDVGRAHRLDTPAQRRALPSTTAAVPGRAVDRARNGAGGTASRRAPWAAPTWTTWSCSATATTGKIQHNHWTVQIRNGIA
jgi:hypothetical protein